MSPEICPFCGKTFKRLKSHLPHCKAAGSSKTSTTKPDVKGNQRVLPSLPDAPPSKPKAKGKKITQTLLATATPSKKTEMALFEPSAPPLQSGDVSYMSQSLSQSPVLPSTSTKKKKQKLSEQIKAAKMTSSPPPIISESQKKSLYALEEAPKSEQDPTGLLGGTIPASENLPLTLSLFVGDSISSSKEETKNFHQRESVKDKNPALLTSSDLKPQVASKIKAKKVAQFDPTTKDTCLETELEEGLQLRDKLRVENEEKISDYSTNNMFLRAGSGRQARITLQDVKATLGRANNSRPSILSQTHKDEPRVNKTTRKPPAKSLSSSLVAAKAQSEQTQLQSLKETTPKPGRASLIPLQKHVSPQPELTTSSASILSRHLLNQVNRAEPPSQTFNTEGLKAGQRQTGVLAASPSLSQFSSPHTLHLPPQTLLARGETMRANDWSQLGTRTQNTADNASKGCLTERSLAQVRLRELPEWLICKTPTHPRDMMQMVQRGWQWYYRRYIDVKRGGVGGVGMLLAGYCVLSYIWSYPHIKRDRWRKYH